MRVWMSVLMCLAMVVFVGCGGETVVNDAPAANDAPEEAAPAAAPVEAPEAAPVTAPEAEESDAAAATAPEEVMEESALAESAPTEDLTAENIVGSKWDYQGITLEFKPDGVVTINDELEGTFTIEGSELILDSDMGEYVATIEGSVLTYDGSALERLQ